MQRHLVNKHMLASEFHLDSEAPPSGGIGEAMPHTTRLSTAPLVSAELFVHSRHAPVEYGRREGRFEGSNASELHFPDSPSQPPHRKSSGTESLTSVQKCMAA